MQFNEHGMTIPSPGAPFSGLRPWLARCWSPLRFWLLFACLLPSLLGADGSPGKFAFHIFPPANGQDLGFASRPVSDGKGGFWFKNGQSVWRVFLPRRNPAAGKRNAYRCAQNDAR